MLTDRNMLYRYPGTKPFEANESELFRGRDDDIKNLYELISLQNLVVLFGRSGLGKSSLLNAGLISCFSNEPDIVPLFLRFGAYYGQSPVSPFRKTYESLKSSEAVSGTNFIYEKLIPEDQIAQQPLWYVFKSYQVANPGKRRFVLIFDQFEELFTYPQQEIELFKKELSELLYVSVPQQLRNQLKEKLRSDSNYLDPGEGDMLFDPLSIKVLFSIRSDKLSLLNKFSDYFPSVLKLCYELKPLQLRQARQAIEEPAKLQGAGYIAPAFTFTEEAINLLLSSLTVEKPAADEDTAGFQPEIETFQLQIVCKHAENLVIEKGTREIAARDLGNIKEIFENHYRNIVARLAMADQLPARKLIEEKLIIDGNRVSMPIPFILRDGGMTGRLLDELIGSHILRREQNNTVEISHDTLIEPILKYFEERKRQEALAAELGEKEAQIRKLQQEQEQRAQQLKARRNKLLVSVVSVALILTLGLAGFALRNARVATEQRMVAEMQRRKAIDEKLNADRSAAYALSEKGKAERSAALAMAAQQEAEIQKHIADSIKMIAIEAGNIAKSFANQAMKDRMAIQVQERNTTKIKEAFRLNALAREWIEKGDPTVALRIEEAALREFPDPMIVKSARKIFSQGGFYKKILDKVPDSRILSFTPNGKAFLSSAGLQSMSGDKIWDFPTSAPTILALVFSRDGTRLLTGASDDTVRLWNNKGVLLKKFVIQTDHPAKRNACPGIRTLSFSPDGTKIYASCGGYGAANLYDMSGDLLWKIEHQPGTSLRFAAFSPDGTAILTGPIGKKTGLWDVRTRTLKQEFEDMENTSFAVFSPKGDKVITNNGAWDATGQSLWKFAPLSYDICSVVCSPKGDRLVTRGCHDKIVRIWDLNTGNLLQQFEGHTDYVSDVAFSEDGQLVYTSSSDSSIRAWTVKGALVHEFKLPIRRDNRNMIAFSDDGNLIVSGSGTGTVEVWNTKGVREALCDSRIDSISCAAFAPDGKSFITGSSRGIGRIWSVRGALFKELNLGKDGAGLTAIAFSPNGSRILTGSAEGKITTWDLNGTMLNELNEVAGGYSLITSIALSPDGTSLVVGTLPTSYRMTDEKVILLNLDGTLIREIGKGSSAAFSPDGRKIIVGSRRFPTGAAVYGTDGQLLCSWDNPGEVLSVSFSPDNKTVILGQENGSVQVYKSPMALEEFLESDNLHKLTASQKQEFGIR